MVCSKAHHAALWLGVFALIMFASTAIKAELRVCNLTVNLVNLAVGIPTNNGLRTEGWWVVTGNGCAPVIRGELPSRYVYLHAKDIYGKNLIGEGTAMCVRTNKFDILGEDNCWQRGYRKALFAEVDTGNSTTWTVYLSDEVTQTSDTNDTTLQLQPGKQ